MLRGMQRNDSVNRIELWGTSGTKVVGGRAVPLSNWKVSLNFTMNAMRFDYTPQGGQRTIEVVSDKFAWNEDTPGGKATAMPAALQDRQVQLVLTPIGMAKAAKAAGDAAKIADGRRRHDADLPGQRRDHYRHAEQLHGAGQGRGTLRNDRI